MQHRRRLQQIAAGKSPSKRRGLGAIACDRAREHLGEPSSACGARESDRHLLGMALHIGIVGCSAEGAALCYRTICTEGPERFGPHAHPEVSMHTASLAAY